MKGRKDAPSRRSRRISRFDCADRQHRLGGRVGPPRARDLDFRGTLGVDRGAPVGFTAIRLSFELDTDVDDAQLNTLKQLTKRYCVVYQTLAGGPALTTTISAV